VKREEVFQQAVLPEPKSQATAEEIEKRHHTRFPVSASAEVVDAKTQVRVTGRVTDLGVGGCYIDTLTTLSEGSEVEVLLHWRGQNLHLQALVSYAISGRNVGMGLAFTRIPADEGATLLDWLTGLGSGSARQPLHETQSRIALPATSAAIKPSDLKLAIEELITVLVRKQQLTASEGARIRDRLVRNEVQDAP
jgi:hypothetical protein